MYITTFVCARAHGLALHASVCITWTLQSEATHPLHLIQFHAHPQGAEAQVWLLLLLLLLPFNLISRQLLLLLLFNMTSKQLLLLLLFKLISDLQAALDPLAPSAHLAAADLQVAWPSLLLWACQRCQEVLPGSWSPQAEMLAKQSSMSSRAGEPDSRELMAPHSFSALFKTTKSNLGSFPCISSCDRHFAINVTRAWKLLFANLVSWQLQGHHPPRKGLPPAMQVPSMNSLKSSQHSWTRYSWWWRPPCIQPCPCGQSGTLRSKSPSHLCKQQFALGGGCSS